jgi:hypothetical protein
LGEYTVTHTCTRARLVPEPVPVPTWNIPANHLASFSISSIDLGFLSSSLTTLNSASPIGSLDCGRGCDPPLAIPFACVWNAPDM